MRIFVRFLSILTLLVPAQTIFGDDSGKLLRVDHYVRVRSSVPVIKGQDAEIYVREVV